ncbi:MAG: ribonuclease P protein component [Bdellovibrionales bacterium]|nr:ribonuclease P protein component [Bdellovibrionales bacterium]
MENSKNLSSLKRKFEFQRLKLQGKKLNASSWLLVNFAKNQVGHLRIGCTLPARIGPAVTRNRLRRWSKEFFRRQDLTLNVDISLVFREFRDAEDGYKSLKHADFDRILKKTWESVKERTS